MKHIQETPSGPFIYTCATNMLNSYVKTDFLVHTENIYLDYAGSPCSSYAWIFILNLLPLGLNNVFIKLSGV